MSYFDCLTLNSSFCSETIKFPLYAENDVMLEKWKQHLIYYLAQWGGQNLENKFLHHDSKNQIYWWQLQPFANLCSALVETGRACYNELWLQQRNSLTNWNFPFLNKPELDKKLPQEEPILGVELLFRGWDSNVDIEKNILTDMNDYYWNWDNCTTGNFLCVVDNGHIETPYQGKVETITVASLTIPTTALHLFELGVRIAAFNRKMQEQKTAKQTRFTESINTKITQIRQLATQRPLLAREKYELDILQKLQQAQTTDALQQLQSEVENNPADADLKAILLKRIAKKMEFF